MSQVVSSYYSNNHLVNSKIYKNYDLFVKSHSYDNYIGFFEGRFYSFLLAHIGIKNNLSYEFIDFCRYSCRFENQNTFTICGWCRGLNIWKEHKFTVSSLQRSVMIQLIKDQSISDYNTKMGIITPQW